MIRNFSIVLMAASIVGCASTNERFPPEQMPPQALHAPERFIVVAVADAERALPTRAGSTPRAYGGSRGYIASGAARAAMAKLAEDYGVRQVAAWPIASLHFYCVVFELPATAAPAAVLAQLSGDPRVKLAQPLQTFHTSSAAYNDPYIGLQRGFAEVNAAGAQQWSRGAGVRVAVIDTGVDLHHPDLNGRVSVARNLVDEDAAQFSRDRHGTEVAGVIAARANNRLGIVGIAPEVELLALKACWETAPGSDAAQCNSFTLAKGLVAAEELRADVVNLSLVGPGDPLLTLLVEQGIRRGIVFIGAVPPDGKLAGFPAAVAGVLAVDGAELDRPANGSLRAPAEDILTLTSGGRYDFVSGSSVAAAHVSGAAALLLSRERALTPAKIRALLESAAEPATATVGRISPINACAALAALLHQPRCDGAAQANAVPPYSVSPIASVRPLP